MRVKFEAVFKFYVVCLVALLVWSVWSATAAETNTQPAKVIERTNALDALMSTNMVLHFGLKNVEALQPKLLGTPLWQYVASLIYIALAFIVSRLLDWLIRGKLKAWAAKTKTRFDDILIQLLGGPIKVISFVILLHIGLQFCPWPPTVELYISRVLRVVLAISLTYVALRLIDVLIDYWRHRASAAGDRGLSDQLLPFMRATLKVFIAVVAVLLVCESLGLPMKGLLASLSVGGLALGLAAQDTLANLFGAFAVFVDKPFRVGEFVKIESVDGVVESIGMRSTRVRTPDGHLVAIPNKTVGNAIITNIAKRPTIRTVMNLGLTYDTSAERVKRAIALLEEIYKSHKMTKDVLITFNRFADSSLNIEVVHVWDSNDFRAYLSGLQELNLKVKERFDAEKLEFAYPTRMLYVKSVDTTSA